MSSCSGIDCDDVDSVSNECFRSCVFIYSPFLFSLRRACVLNKKYNDEAALVYHWRERESHMHLFAAGRILCAKCVCVRILSEQVTTINIYMPIHMRAGTYTHTRAYIHTYARARTYTHAQCTDLPMQFTLSRCNFDRDGS